MADVFAAPWLALVIGGGTYGVAYLVLSYAPGIAEPAAIRVPVVERAQALLARLAPRKEAPYGDPAFYASAVITHQGDK
jgi:hypothetical protein